MPRKTRKSKKIRAKARRRELEGDRELPIWPETVQGTKYVRELEKLVSQLREENPHGNRELRLDDVFVAHLLCFFNSSIRSLRTIEDFSQTRQGQRVLAIQRISKSTLSDYHKFADAERLKPIIQKLRARVSRKFVGQRLPTDLEMLGKEILAADGTFFRAAADVAWAIGHRNQHQGKKFRARLDAQVNIATWLPELLTIPENGEGEAEQAARAVKAGAIHLYDRGYNSFELVRAHYCEVDGDWVPHAEFVIRGKKNQLLMETIEERPLSAEQQQEGIISDRITRFCGSKKHKAPPVIVREVVLYSDSTRSQEKTVRLITNLLDVPPEVIGLLYRHRWQIELFFRWLKCYAHFDHLISHNRHGTMLQFYVVVIGVLLLYLFTGGQPSKYAMALLSTVATGGGSLDDIMPILKERERQCAVARAGAARRRARKKAESQ